MASLRAHVKGILEMRVYEPESTPVDLVEDTVLDALFTASIASLETREHAKSHGSIHTTDGKDVRAWKNE